MSQAKKNILIKVAAISSICTMAFGFRGFADISNIFWQEVVANSWWINGGFFIVLELMPLLLILYILHVNEVRPKRHSHHSDGLTSVDTSHNHYHHGLYHTPSHYNTPVMYISSEPAEDDISDSDIQ